MNEKYEMSSNSIIIHTNTKSFCDVYDALSESIILEDTKNAFKIMKNWDNNINNIGKEIVIINYNLSSTNGHTVVYKSSFPN
jgi:hypothetical protein